MQNTETVLFAWKNKGSGENENRFINQSEIDISTSVRKLLPRQRRTSHSQLQKDSASDGSGDRDPKSDCQG